MISARASLRSARILPDALSCKRTSIIRKNFGLLEGGWLQLTMPEFGLGQPILGYASDAVAAVASADHTDLQGLAGLPLLRLIEYGGDASSFWLRAVSSQV